MTRLVGLLFSWLTALYFGNQTAPRLLTGDKNRISHELYNRLDNATINEKIHNNQLNINIYTQKVQYHIIMYVGAVSDYSNFASFNYFSNLTHSSSPQSPAIQRHGSQPYVSIFKHTKWFINRECLIGLIG